ncbi:MAG: GNVR domain-containing protein [Hyphomicrobiales bacterium]
MEVRELVAHLARRWRVIATCVAASLLLAAGYLLVVPAEYLGIATLLIDPNANVSLTADTGIARSPPDPSSVENQLKLVVSDNVLRRVVDHEKLISDIEFGQRPKGIMAFILERLRLARPSSDDPVTAAIATLRDHVYTRRSERSFVIDIGVYAREARKSARLTDALAQAFIEEDNAARVAIARQQSNEIKARLADLKARIEAAETRVEQYKKQHGIFDNEGRPLTTQQLADAEHDLSQAHLRTVEAKARLDQIRAGMAAGRDPAALPDALRSVAIERIKTQIADITRQLANLRTTLGPRHPAYLESENQLREARALLQVELRRVAEAARNDYDIAAANEAALQKRVGELRAKSSDTNEAMVQMRELQRDVEVSHAIYDRFLKASGFAASDALDTPTARTISAAQVPTRPESPRRLVVLSIALALGLGLGLGLALLSAAPAAGRPVSPRPHDSTSGARDADDRAPRSGVGAGSRGSSGRSPRAQDAGLLEAGAHDPASPAEQPQAPAPAVTQSAALENDAAAGARLILRHVVPSPAADREDAAARTGATGARGPEAPVSAAAWGALGAGTASPARFDIPALPSSAEAEASLAAKLRVARDNPEMLLPHSREVELHPSSAFSRIMRELRRALSGRSAPSPLVVAITSEARGCGKSTLAINLARAFADNGSRVLILDADRRNASLTQAMGTPASEGTVRLADAMRPVFALDGSWRSGVFLASLALGRSDRRTGTRMPSFAGPRALADVLIIDTQTGTRGPALGPDLAVGATLAVGPAGESETVSPAFARVTLIDGSRGFSGGALPRRPAMASL